MHRVLIFAAWMVVAGVAHAQNFDRPLTIIVPTSPSTGPDIISRQLAPYLSKRIAQPVVVENRVGASGAIGIGQAANAAPDGQTILITPNTIAMLPALRKSLAWDPVKDFKPVNRLAVLVFTLVVSPSLPAKSAEEFVALAKSKPGQLNYASPGIGTPQHLGFELFKQVAGIQVTHIPYKGSSGALTDLVAGQVQAGIFAVQSVMPLWKGGRLRMLATIGDKRSPWTPDVPTFQEAGLPNVDVDAWLGVLAPRDTSSAMVDRLSREFLAILAQEDVKEALFQKGMIVSPGGPTEMGQLMESDVAKWKKVVMQAGLSPE